MIVVLDASAAVKLVLDEVGSEQVRRVWDEDLSIVAPTILGPEVAAAIRAASRAGRVAAEDRDVAQRSWVSLLGEVNIRVVDVELADRARVLAADRAIRGMDAVYIAVALQLAESGPTGLLSFDDRQRCALTPDDEIRLLPAAVDC